MVAFSGGAFGGGEVDTGTADALQASKYLGYGEVNVDFPDEWYQLDGNYEFIRDSHGAKIFGGFPGTPLLDSHRSPILDSNGRPVYDRTGPLGGYDSPYVLDSLNEIVLDADEEPVLVKNWRAKIVRGIATQLDTLETTIQYVTIQAKFTNLGKIWVGGYNVRRFRGIYINAGEIYTIPSIDDLRKVYIIGNAGEGVSFQYGLREDIFLTSPDESPIEAQDGEQINV